MSSAKSMTTFAFTVDVVYSNRDEAEQHLEILCPRQPASDTADEHTLKLETAIEEQITRLHEIWDETFFLGLGSSIDCRSWLEEAQSDILEVAKLLSDSMSSYWSTDDMTYQMSDVTFTCKIDGEAEEIKLALK